MSPTKPSNAGVSQNSQPQVMNNITYNTSIYGGQGGSGGQGGEKGGSGGAGEGPIVHQNFPSSTVVQASRLINHCPPPSRIFHGRRTILDAMHQFFAQDTRKQKVYVLYGLGGAGKTQVALKFIEEWTHFTDQLLVDASTTETIETGLKNIAARKQSGDSVPDALSWLIDNQEEWLLFFDNADDPNINLNQFFPKCNHGNIIITSRNPNLRGYGAHSPVSDMEESDAVVLLLKSAQQEASEANEVLALDIVKSDGSNFMIFQRRFSTFMRLKSLWGHFDGTTPRPDEDDNIPDEDLDKWDKEEYESNNYLAQRLEDITFLKISNMATVAMMWEQLSNEFTALSSHIIASMQADFDNCNCSEKENVRTHLDQLRIKYMALVGVGVVMSDSQYSTRIINSLPRAYQRYLATIISSVKAALIATNIARTTATAATTSASAAGARSAAAGLSIISGNTVATQAVTLDPEYLMHLATEEWDRIEAEKKKNSPKSRNDNTGVALSALPQWNGASSSSRSGKPSGKGNRKGNDQRPKGVCWNCGGKGHVRSKCPSPKQNGKPDASGSANAAVDFDDDGAWSVEPMDCATDSGLTTDTSARLCVAAETVFDMEELFEPWNSYPELTLMSVSDSETALGVDANRYEYLLDIWPDLLDVEVSDDPCAEDLPPMDDECSEFDWSDSVSDSMPVLLDVSDSSDEESNGEESDASRFVHAMCSLAAIETADAVTTGEKMSAPTELYDSGCTQHLSPYEHEFSNLVAITPKEFSAANNQRFAATASGNLTISIPNGDTTSKIELSNVLYAPDLAYTLVSIGCLDEAGFTVTFGNGKCRVTNVSGTQVGLIMKSTKGLYKVVHEPDCANPVERELTEQELHRVLGHISPAAAKSLVSNGLVSGIHLTPTSTDTKPFFCKSCVYAKMRCKSVPKERKGEHAENHGDLVYSDVWGPSRVETLGHHRYFSTFTDDAKRETYLYFMWKKSDTLAAYKVYSIRMKTHHGFTIKVLQSDNGGEYVNQAFANYLSSQGTVQRFTVHDTPEENGVAERLNGVLVEKCRALLHASGLPKFLWGECLRHVAVHGRKPDFSDVHEWGCKCYVHQQMDVVKQSKLDPRAKEGRWMGLDDASQGHRIYWPGERKVSVERTVVFQPFTAILDENEGEHSAPLSLPAPQLGKNSVSSPPSTPSIKNSPAPEHIPLPPSDISDPPSSSATPPPDSPITLEPRRSVRNRAPSRYARDITSGEGSTDNFARSRGRLPQGMHADAVDESTEYALVADISEVEGIEPHNLAEARRSPDWPHWEKAIKEELATLEANNTWELVNTPESANIVGNKWVFRIKRDAAGRVQRYKARLVAQGFSQVEGVDYFDTFAPVARLSSVRTILALAARLDLEIHQIDIKGAYLNGKLTEKERIFMRQPTGFPYPNSTGKILRLIKTLYGLKQSGRRWYQRLSEICEKLGLMRCSTDQAVFYRRNDAGIVIVSVHVDDCTIAASNMTLINEVKAGIAKYVEIVDLGEIHWLLGIKVKRNRAERTLSLSQKAYITSIVRRYNLDDLKPYSIPMDPNLHLSSSQSPHTAEELAVMRSVPYKEAVGSVMYASLATRPDITFVVTKLSKFSVNPGSAHWDAAKRVICYLNGTADLELTYGETSGFAYLIDGGAVSWNSKQQELVVLSTTEAEYVAATHASKEGLWLRSFISEVFDTYASPPINSSPTTLFSDNKLAIALAKEHQYHARTKHIDIRYHFIRYIIANGSMNLIYCPTDEMIADTLTKPLASVKAKHFAVELGLRSA
ncbi:Transcription factor [Mycena sanguinolenta]|uniref:Transcription factor n=1 Tax=Mycena sanguinolenta TaxID=230812 RepID=A0A8H6Z624_9AGAR|nr:Transcription factor [Mycena sanguinolenta]